MAASFESKYLYSSHSVPKVILSVLLVPRVDSRFYAVGRVGRISGYPIHSDTKGRLLGVLWTL